MTVRVRKMSTNCILNSHFDFILVHTICQKHDVKTQRILVVVTQLLLLAAFKSKATYIVLHSGRDSLSPLSYLVGIMVQENFLHVVDCRLSIVDCRSGHHQIQN